MSKKNAYKINDLSIESSFGFEYDDILPSLLDNIGRMSRYGENGGCIVTGIAKVESVYNYSDCVDINIKCVGTDIAIRVLNALSEGQSNEDNKRTGTESSRI